MSNENFTVPSACGVAVGRQLLKNVANTDMAFSILLSSAPKTALANAFVKPARFFTEYISIYTLVYSEGKRANKLLMIPVFP